MRFRPRRSPERHSRPDLESLPLRLLPRRAAALSTFVRGGALSYEPGSRSRAARPPSGAHTARSSKVGANAKIRPHIRRRKLG